MFVFLLHCSTSKANNRLLGFWPGWIKSCDMFFFHFFFFCRKRASNAVTMLDECYHSFFSLKKRSFLFFVHYVYMFCLFFNWQPLRRMARVSTISSTREERVPGTFYAVAMFGYDVWVRTKIALDIRTYTDTTRYPWDWLNGLTSVVGWGYTRSYFYYFIISDPLLLPPSYYGGP